MAKHDIVNRDDIALLVHTFYERVIPDPVIGSFFTEVTHFNLETHLPVMISFWETVLLGAVSYKGNPMVKHAELHMMQRMMPAHFDRWLELWASTVHGLFEGEHASLAVEKAESIARLMQHKLDQYTQDETKS